jgi:calcineurin-like phosphoesterase family protein
MKIRLISDLHTEYGPWSYVNKGEDLVLFAGDIVAGYFGNRLDVLSEETKGIPCYFVAGNHEFYNREVYEQWQQLRSFELKYPHFKWLENEYVDLPGYRLCGCTLWTDFLLNGEGHQNKAIALAHNNIRDFSAILDRGTYLHPRTLLHWNFESRYFLEEQVKTSELPLIVMTHFLPTRYAINEEYADDPHNPYFACRMDPLFSPKIPLWVHGHSHMHFDQVFNGTRVVRNPLGYTREQSRSGFISDLIIELP